MCGGRLATSILVAAAALIVSTGSMPRPVGFPVWDAALLWGNVALQLMNFREGHKAPRREAADKLMEQLPQQGSLEPLPDDLSAEQEDWHDRLREAFPSRPVVVRRLMQRESRRFSGVLGLNHRTLREVYNDTRVGVFTDMIHDKSVVPMEFAAYTREMVNHSRMLYARAIGDVKRVMSENVPVAWIADILDLKFSHEFSKMIKKRDGCCVLFVGSNHTFSNGHCDIGTSVFLMVEGRKRWVFYPPEQSLLLYPAGQSRNVAFNVGLDIFRPDVKSAPLFEQAHGYELIVEPGDVLFFPSMWWHGVQNLDLITVGIDVPFWDLAGSWQRNSILTAATLLNPRLMFDLTRGILSGRSIRDIFFAGYSKD